MATEKTVMPRRRRVQKADHAARTEEAANPHGGPPPPQAGYGSKPVPKARLDRSGRAGWLTMSAPEAITDKGTQPEATCSDVSSSGLSAD